MTGFQIPGLGQAKPNESLPPLTPDLLVAAAASAGADKADDPPQNALPDAKTAVEAEADTATASASPPKNAHNPQDAMNVDEPESPPSLTGALEAAIGGLDAAASDAPSRAQPPADTNEAELRNDEGEHPEWELDSSPYESSSSGSSSSSSSSDEEDSDNEGYRLLNAEETARLLMEAEGGSDDEGPDRGKGSAAAAAAQLRTKNELALEIPPRPDITITPETKLEELGFVENIVDGILLIKAITPGEYQVLDAGSVLCTADRRVVGAVAETMGKVLQPMYTVHFASGDEITDLGLEVGTKLFYPVEHASYVFTQPLRNLKGSDASNLHDEEVGDDEMEFSDDEKEAEYKRALKQKKREKGKGKSEAPGAGARGAAHPLSQELTADGALNYDDDDGPYKPLARPRGFASGPQPASETTGPTPRRGGGSRRGGRGTDGGRGRGGRGRASSARGGHRHRGGHAPPAAQRDGHALPPRGRPPHAYTAPNMPSTAQAAPPPAVPDFGFQLPAAWPHTQGQLPAAPPPGWPAQAQGQPAPPNAFLNPAFVAALMSQMRQQPWQPPPGSQGPGP